MNKMFAVVALAAVVVGSVAFGMSREQPVSETRVQQQIDGRLHEVLVKMRMHRGR